MKDIVFIIIISLLLFLSGCKDKSLEEKREFILSELNLAIEDAVEQGIYKCCIEPACTMCYINGNKWNMLL